MWRDLLDAWARKLKPDDVVVTEATANAAAAVEVMSPCAGKVAVANPSRYG